MVGEVAAGGEPDLRRNHGDDHHAPPNHSRPRAHQGNDVTAARSTLATLSTVYFETDTAVLDAAQALCVALPAAGLPPMLARLGGRGWSLVAPLSVVLTVVAITVAAASADVLTWVALLLVPPACALALGWAAHGARPWMAVLVVPMLAAALVAPDDPLGRAGRLALIVGSVVTAGRLLAGAAPLIYLKAGVVRDGDDRRGLHLRRLLR